MEGGVSRGGRPTIGWNCKSSASRNCFVFPATWRVEEVTGSHMHVTLYLGASSERFMVFFVFVFGGEIDHDFLPGGSVCFCEFSIRPIDRVNIMSSVYVGWGRKWTEGFSEFWEYSIG